MIENNEWQRLVEMNRVTEYWIGRCSRAEQQLEQYKWTSFEDRMPEVGKPILIYSERTEYILGYFIYEEEFIAKNGCPISLEYLIDIHAYWISLSTPPKE